jgi:1-acyl-sn-glycerol-3-phosphate acyltransferase
MLEFKNGATKIAMLANVPIMPVTIRGANKVWAQDMKLPRLGKVDIFYHPLMEIPRDRDDREQIDKFTDKLEEIIKSKM